MIKKYFLYFLFFLSYGVVLLHTVVPHVHHEEKRLMSQHHQDHEEENDPIGFLFSHLQHQQGSKDITYSAKSTQESKISKYAGGIQKLNNPPIKLIRLSSDPPENLDQFIPPLTPSKLFFRGPPCFS
jgi:hypothetical protein